jgi:phosphoglycerate kinase
MQFLGLDNADVKGKTALVRVDINSPIDSKTGEILDDTRIRECAPTIKELAMKGAKVVVLAHQGRAGDEDFTTLEKHAKKLSAALGLDVKYSPFSLLGPVAAGTVQLMRPSEVVMFENIRFLAEESLSGSPEELAKTHLVKRLASMAQVYVNDAFGAAHRSSPSLVGFAHVLPTYAGRLMERELNGLGKALTPERPCVYVLGGAKFDDSLRIIENVFTKGIADTVLPGGLVANALLVAAGADLGKLNIDFMNAKGYPKEAGLAKRLIEQYGDKISGPVDFVVNAGGQPKVISINELPTEFQILDIGPKTVEEYSKVIAGAKTVVANGPPGAFEKPGFEKGTFGVMKAMADSQAFTIIGGGHIVAAANAAGVASRMKHISTGGGASITFLTGGKMPAVEALLSAAERMRAASK